MEKAKGLEFSRENSQLLKGIAILMMVFHHYIGFPSFVSEDNWWVCFTDTGSWLMTELALYCKICVGLYIFITGYALGLKGSDLKSRLRKIGQFLCKYWYYYFLILLIGVLFSEPLPPANLMLKQLFGLCTGTGYGKEFRAFIHPIFAWYVSVYIAFMLSFSFIRRLCRISPAADFIIVFLMLNIIYSAVCVLNADTGVVPPYMLKLLRHLAVYAPVGTLGYLFSKYGLFEQISAPINKYLNSGFKRYSAAVIILAVSIIMRTVLRNRYGQYLLIRDAVSPEFIFVAAFIFAFLLLIDVFRKPHVRKVLLTFSKYNFGIWMLQALPFTPNRTFQSLFYLGGIHPAAVFVVASAILLVLSIITEGVYGRLSDIAGKAFA